MTSLQVMITANSTWNLAHFRGPIIDALIARGGKVIVAAPADGYEQILRGRGCNVVDLSVDSKGVNPVRDLALVYRLWRIYKKYSPDVVLNFTIKPVIYGTLAAWPARIPVINTITGLGTAFIKKNWISEAVRQLYRTALPSCRHIVFQNKDDLALFRDLGLVSHDSVTIVAGSGVDLSRFCPSPLPTLSAVTFLFIGRVLSDKGVREFAEAAREISKSNKQCRFQILGPVDVANRTLIRKDELEHWVSQGIVEYLGSTDDVRPFIEKAHCVVLPSYREGMPRVLIEAAAMGRPLIATDVPGCREVVKDGLNGFLCYPMDGKDLAAKIAKFLGLSVEERQMMGHASRKLATEVFDVRQVVSTYLALIDAQKRNLIT